MKNSSKGGPYRDPPPAVPDYTLLRFIGRGSYGEVWLARNDALLTYCAIKLVYREVFSDEAPYLTEFEGLRNYSPLSRREEGFVGVYHAARNDAEGYFYYVMDLADDASSVADVGEVPTGTAKVVPPQAYTFSRPSTPDQETYQPRTLRSDQKLRRRLPVRRCVELGVSLSVALEKLHDAGLVHRDIKPANVIFVNNQPRLADLGLVTTIGHRTLVGTDGFRAPEGPGTKAADVYSLGMTLYTLATGAEPHPSLSLPAGLPDHKELLELNAVILRACEADLKRRYQTMTELRTDLAYLLAGRSVKRDRMFEKLRRVALYAIPALLLLGGAIAFMARWRAEMVGALQASRKAEGKAVEANAQERQRRLIQQSQFLRLNPHGAGWRKQTWDLARKAAETRRSEDVRNYAAAALVGIDVTLSRSFRDMEVHHLALSRDKDMILIYGSTNSTEGTPHQALWLWTRATDEVRVWPAHGRGPSGFLTNDLPVHLIQQSNQPLVSILWDVQRGKAIREFVVPTNGADLRESGFWTSTRQLSRDGSMVAVTQPFSKTNGVLCVWGTESGELLCQTSLSNAWMMNALVFSPDGSFLAGGDDQGGITVWRLPSGRVHARLRDSGAKIYGLAFHLEDRAQTAPEMKRNWLLAAGDAGGIVTIWNLSTGKPHVHCFGSEYDVFSVAFSPDGMTLASAGRTEIRLWDRATGRYLLSIPSCDHPIGLEFSGDGSSLLVAGRPSESSAAFCVWDVHAGRGTQTLRGLRSRVSRVCFSRDGRRLAGFGHNWEVGVWDLQTGRLLRVLDVPQGFVSDNVSMAWSPDGRQFAYATDNTAVLWDTETGAELNQWKSWKGFGETLAFSGPDHLLLLRVETTNQLQGPYSSAPPSQYPRVCRLRDLLAAPSKPILEYQDFNWGARALASSQDGRFFFGDGFRRDDNRTVRAISCWEGLSGTQLWSIAAPGLDAQMRPLQVDSSGEILVTTLENDGPPVWLDARSGRPLRPRSAYFPLALGPGGTNWVTIGLPETVGLERRGLSLFVGEAASPSVTLGIDLPTASLHPAFSSNGQLLAWGQNDGSVHVYNLHEIRQQLMELGLGW